MTIRSFTTALLKDFLIATGFLTLVTSVFVALSALTTVPPVYLCRILLLAGAFTLYRHAFVPKFELPETAQALSFFLCSLGADILIVVLLFFFSPGRLYDMTLFFLYLAVMLLIKGAVYAMMRQNGRQQAAELNDRLNAFKTRLNG